MEILKRILRVVQVLLIPAKIALLIIPIFAVMAYTNYSIDCSGLYQGDLTTRTIVEYLLEGENVSNFTQMDERAVLSLYTQLIDDEDAPTTIAVGSSRVMQLGEELMGDDFYNAGMTGADYRDIMNAVYLFDRADILPENIIINIDPWVLRSDAEYLDARTDVALFNEFCSVALGMSTDYEPVEETEEFMRADALVQAFSARFLEEEVSLSDFNITSTTLEALFDPAYFQGNLYYEARTANDDIATTEDGEEIPFVALTDAEMQNLESETKLSDGTVFYAKSFRESSDDEVLSYAHGQAGTFLRMLQYTELDTEQCAFFEEFIDYLVEKDVNIYFMLSPYHPFTYQYQSAYNMESVSGFFEIEPYLRELAAAYDIPVIGSYDPSVLGLDESDFFDGLHVRDTGIEKYFGGLSSTGEVLAGTVVDSNTLFTEEEGDELAGEESDEIA